MLIDCLWNKTSELVYSKPFTHQESYFRSKGLIHRYTEVAKNRKMNEPQLYAIISMSEPN